MDWKEGGGNPIDWNEEGHINEYSLIVYGITRRSEAEVGEGRTSSRHGNQKELEGQGKMRWGQSSIDKGPLLICH